MVNLDKLVGDILFKRVFLLVSFILILFPYSVFADSLSINDGLLDSSKVVSNTLPKEVYDNSNSTFSGKSDMGVVVFDSPITIGKIYVNAENFQSTGQLRIVFLDDNGVEKYTYQSFTVGESYSDISIDNVISVEFFNNANYKKKVFEVELFEGVPDKEPPKNIKNLKETVSSDSVIFNYDLPTDRDFSHLQIYRDNNLIMDNYSLDTFKDKNLKPETEYDYVFKSVDDNGLVSQGTLVTIKTGKDEDLEPPSPPVGLNVTEGNSSLAVNWYSNSESDVAGYNLYVNGEKYNSSLIKGTSYTLSNLNNGMDYEINVTAVDTSDNESKHSKPVIESPNKDSMPLFTIKTDINDVGTSIENVFGELWLILAFSVSIPLSFLIARRVKSLFLA